MRSRRTKVIIGAFIVLVAATVLLLFMDFQAAESASNVNSNVTKTTFHMAPDAPPRPEGTLILYVAGDGELHDDLEKALVQRLESMAAIEVTLLGSLPSESSSPMLMVEAKPDALVWTPAYASARVATEMVYASDGDVSWRDDAVVVMGGKDGAPQLRVRGDLKLEDTTRGVISKPAYQHHLAQQIAIAVSDILKKQIHENG